MEKQKRGFKENDVVRIENQDKWDRKAIVFEEVCPRSLTVRTDDGLRRNRRSLLKTQEGSQMNMQELKDSVRFSQGEESSTQTKEADTPDLRRSTRPCKPPERLIENV